MNDAVNRPEVVPDTGCGAVAGPVIVMRAGSDVDASNETATWTGVALRVRVSSPESSSTNRTRSAKYGLVVLTRRVRVPSGTAITIVADLTAD